MSSREALCTLPAGAPDGNIRLFCKGSDSKVLAMLRPEPGGARRAGGLLAATHENLHVFATHVRPCHSRAASRAVRTHGCSVAVSRRPGIVNLRALPRSRAAARSSKPVGDCHGVPGCARLSLLHISMHGASELSGLVAEAGLAPTRSQPFQDCDQWGRFWRA